MKTKILAFFLSAFTLLTFAQQEIYNETFSATNGWPTGTNSTRVLEVKNGKYYFEHLRDDKNWNVTTRDITIDTSSDFEFEVSFQKISGTKSHATGLMYGTKDSENTYHFVLSNGEYRVSEKKDDAFIVIKGWTKSSSIKTAYYAYNKLKIKKQGSKMYYYINGTLVTTQDYKSFHGKKLGMLVYNEQKIAIDYIKATELATPVVKKAESKTILFEGFNSNANNWSLKDDADATFKVTGGDYVIEHKSTTSSWTTTIAKKFDTSRNFRISAQIKKINGVQNYGYGLIFGRKNADNHNKFFISANGSYTIIKYDNSKRTFLKSWTKSEHIKTGNGVLNTLTIKKTGTKTDYLINSKIVYTSYSTKYYGDLIGFSADNKQKIAVAYLSMAYTDNKKTITPIVKKETESKSILFEGFNNNTNNWSLKDDADATFKVTGGDYVLQHRSTTSSWTTTIDRKFDTSRDFRISAQIKKVKGVLNHGYGLLFGRKNTDNHNRFLASGDGSYMISKFENGKKTVVKKWTKSSHIKTGNGVFNTLTIKKTGTKTDYLINSKIVYTNYSTKYYGDRTGFSVNNKQTVAIGYLSISYEDKKKTITPTITNSHNIKESILFDGFTSNKNSWAEKNTTEINLNVKDGDYIFDHKRPKGGWSSTIKKYIDTSRDFKILADFKKISGIENNGYGVIFGREDTNNQNLFYVNGNGSYSINKIKNGKDNYKKDWVKSSAIRKGNNAYNVLKVIKVGSKIEYYINNTKVYTDYSPEFFGDRLGFIVYDKQKVSIAYLSVGYLDTKKTTTDTIVTDNIKTYNYSDSDFYFSDQFTSNKNNWFEQDDEIKTFKIKNGKYYLKHKRNEKGWSTYDTHTIDTSKDFEIETKLDKISGVNNYGYGLVFGKKGNNDYRFYISSTGYYKIARKKDDKEQVIKKWTTTSEVNNGNLKSNVLKVKKEGGYYKFYINGTYITQIDFEEFYGNEIGFVVYNNVEVAVDYLRVKYLNVSKPIVTSKVLQLPLNDQFSSNKNNWSSESVDNYSVDISSGKLNIHRKKEGGIFISKEVDINTSKDFVIETSISRKKTGASGLYGFTFGRKNSSNEFTFIISTNGSYMFRKFDNNVYKKIIPFTSNSAIKTGIDQANKIKIVKSGSLLRFYINDIYMNETSFEPFFGNKMGYTAYYEQKISVDYLNISYQSSSYNNPPVLVITEPNVDLKRGFKIVKTKRIQVKGKATDKDGIYEILINGVDATVYEDGTFVANVPLRVGTNDLIVKATDLKQSSSTKTFTIKRKSPVIDDIKPVVKKEEKVDLTFGTYYALIIGVSDYDESSNVQNLEGLPTKDAKDLSEVLINNYNFKKENVTLLNNSPTENQILREFVKLKKKVTNKDNVLIFFAGHGIYDESTETGSWLPSDADPEYGLNMISNSTIKDYIKGINSKHTLLISDACFSGSIFKTRSYKSAPKSITRKFELPSRKAITSGTLKTVPNKSVFLKYLIDRLNTNQELYLSARKIFDRIEEPVMNNSKNVPQYGTIQEVGDEGGDFIFIKN